MGVLTAPGMVVLHAFNDDDDSCPLAMLLKSNIYISCLLFTHRVDKGIMRERERDWCSVNISPFTERPVKRTENWGSSLSLWNSLRLKCV